MVDQFDKQGKLAVEMKLKSEHPFTILDIKEHYHIRYGWSSRREGYSPNAEVVWQTPSEMLAMGISTESLEAAELAWKTGYHPNPIAPVSTPVVPKRKTKKPGKSMGRKGNSRLDRADDRIQTSSDIRRDTWIKGKSSKVACRV
jgi:hypothetical protein